MSAEQKISDALGSYLKQSGLDVLLRNRKVCEAWQRVVGPDMAAQTRIVGFGRGTLTVEVASSSLLAELETYYQAQLVDSLQRELNNRKVRSIRLRLGSPADEVEEVEDGREKHQGRRKGKARRR
jgi:predicted nucleic acid-binding Zn ribbon protein